MSRKIVIERIPTTTPGLVVEVDIYYNKGGMNFFTGSTEARGYYISATPAKIETHTDSKTGQKYDIKTVTAFSGIKHCVEEAKRYSDKVLDRLAGTAKSAPMYLTCVQHVVSKNGLTLVTPDNPNSEATPTNANDNPTQAEAPCPVA